MGQGRVADLGQRKGGKRGETRNYSQDVIYGRKMKSSKIKIVLTTCYI